MIVSPLSSALVTAPPPVLPGGEGDDGFATVMEGSAPPKDEPSSDDSTLATSFPDGAPLPTVLPPIFPWMPAALEVAPDPATDGEVPPHSAHSDTGLDGPPASSIATPAIAPAPLPSTEQASVAKPPPEPPSGGTTPPAASGPQYSADVPLVVQVQPNSVPSPSMVPVTAAQRLWRMMDHQPDAPPHGELSPHGAEAGPETAAATVGAVVRSATTAFPSPAEAVTAQVPDHTDPATPRAQAASELESHPHKVFPVQTDGLPTTTDVNLTPRDTPLIPLSQITVAGMTHTAPRDAPPLAATFTPQPFVQAVQAHIAAPVPDGVALTLAPEELGRLHMIIQTTDDRLTIAIQADRPETVDLMRRHADQLAQELRQAGFAQTSFSFSQGNSQGSMQGQAQDYARPHPTPQPTAQNSVHMPTSEPAPSRPRPHDTSSALDLRL